MISSTEYDDYVLITLSGKLLGSDKEEAEFMDIFQKTAAHKSPNALIDFSEVTYATSATFKSFIRGYNLLKTKNGKFICFGLSEYMKINIHNTRLDYIFIIVDNLDKAINLVVRK